MEGSARPVRRTVRLLALAGILPVTGVILLGTLGPPAIAETATGLLLHLSTRFGGAGGWALDYGRVQSVANAAMFAPLGGLLAIGTRPARWPVVVLIGPALSVGVELLQRFVPGRVPDGFDVMTNVTGGLLGFLAGGVVVGAVALLDVLLQAARGPFGPRPARPAGHLPA